MLTLPTGWTHLTAAAQANATKQAHPVVHFEIGGRDSTKTQAFYGKLFDWEITQAGPAANISTGGTGGIDGHITALGHEPYNYVTVYVQVEDIQPYLDKAKALGGKTGDYKPAVEKYQAIKVSNFFDASGAATNSFQSGEVIAGAHYASAAWSLADKGLPITYVAPKEGAPTGDIRVHLVKGSKNKALAEKFIDFAVAKEQASCMTEKLYVGPATKGFTISDKAKNRLPWGKDGSIANLALINWTELNGQRQAITDLWNKEIARK